VIEWFVDSGARDAVGALAQQFKRDVYIVGGSVRDRLLGQDSRDVDFSVDRGAMAFARAVARRLSGAYVTLDAEHDTARVVILWHGTRFYLDFAGMQGPDIIADLKRRDFTINALAVPLSDWSSAEPKVIDPCGGLADLENRCLRVTHDQALQDDPVRVIRAVRLVGALGLAVEAHTEELIRRDVGLLANVSGERVRDELALILASRGAFERVKVMDRWGILAVVFPELIPLRDLEQSECHYWDAYHHSLRTVAGVDAIFDPIWFQALVGAKDKAEAALHDALLPYRDRLIAHLEEVLSADRTRMTLLRLTALLHDVGKGVLKKKKPKGYTRFPGHGQEGGPLVEIALRRLRFSNREVGAARTIVQHHMRPGFLVRKPEITRRDAYRFFRDTGEVGLDVLLLSLADHLATRGPMLDLSHWKRHLSAIRILLNIYFKQPEVVDPPKLVDGTILMREIEGLSGWRVGRLLEEVREAQAAGIVRTKEEALAHAREIYAQLVKVERNE